MSRQTTKSEFRRYVRWVRYPFFVSCVLVVAYIVILLVGLVPVNNDFVPSKNGVKIYLVSNAVHADIIVPVTSEVVDWGESLASFDFVGDVSGETHVAFGWGDRGFFLETKTWDDFKVSTAANALLLPSASCVHVTFTRPDYYTEASAVSVSVEQYQQLAQFINSTFATDADGNRIQIGGQAYATTDAFFEANERYHLLNTCNSWVGRALKSAGVRAPWLSPMPKSPMLYIESD